MSADTQFAETFVRDAFAKLGDREAFLGDPHSVWVLEPKYFVVPENLKMETRSEVVAWFDEMHDAFPDMRVEIEDLASIFRAGDALA